MYWSALCGIVLLLQKLTQSSAQLHDVGFLDKGLSANKDHTDQSVKRSVDILTEDLLRSTKIAQGLVPARTRRARTQERRLFNDERGVHRLLSILPLFPLCEHPIDVKTVTVDYLTYAICLSATSRASLGVISTNWINIHTWTLSGPAHVAEIFSYNRIIYVLIANSARADGTELLRYSLDEETVLIDHIINSQYPTSITLWKTNILQSNYHLAIVNSDGPQSTTLRQNVSIYEWKKTYFDRYYSIFGYDVRDVEHFNIRGRDFLAISNHRSPTGRVIAESEIFIYDVNRFIWKSYQRIRTKGAVDMEFFKMGDGRSEEYFLAVANQYEIRNGMKEYDVDSIIYKYARNRFVPFQCIKTSGITGFGTWYTDQFLLVVTNLFGSVQLYQYNGWKFVASKIQYTRHGMGPGALSSSFHRLSGPDDTIADIRLVVSNPTKGVEPNVFSLLFRHENQLAGWYEQSLQWCSNAHHRLNSTNLPDISRKAQGSFLIDQTQPIVLDGGILFNGGVTIPGSLTTPKLEDVGSRRVFDHSILNRLEDLKTRLDGLRGRLSKLRDLMTVSMKTTGPQTVTGKHTYRNAAFNCGDGGCNVGSIKTKFLNGEDVSDLSDKLVFLDRSVAIDSGLTFESLRIRGDFTTNGLIGGVNPSHLVTVTGHHEITAPMTFNRVQANEIVVNGTIGGVRLAAETVLLDHGDQTVTGEITIQNIDAESLTIEGLANGVNVTEFLKDVVLVNERQVITASKTVNGDVVIDDLSLEPGATINGIPLEDLWRNAIWKNQEQELKFPADFSSLTLVNPTVSNINGIFLDDPNIVLLNKDNVITEENTFTASRVSIDNLHVAGNLNGINTMAGNPAWPDQLNILVKSIPQTISGSKTLRSLSLSGASSINGFFGGVNPAELAAKVINRNISQNLTDGEWTFNRVEFRGPVEVRGVIHGMEVQSIYDRALKINESLPVGSVVIFDGLVAVDDMVSHDINGIDVSKDLVLRVHNATVNGIKTFQSVVLTQDSTLGGLVNAVPLNFVEDTLLTINDQHITSTKVIEGDLIIPSLVISGVINGVPLAEPLLIDRDGIIDGPVELSERIEVLNGVNAETMEVRGLINGVEIIEVIEDTLLYSGKQKVSGEINIVGDITVLPNVDFAAATVNGISLGPLARDTVFKDEPRLITGKKTIHANEAKFDSLFLFGSVDGVQALDISQNWMLQDTNQVIIGNVNVEEEIIVHNDVKASTINGIDIIEIAQDTLRLDEPVELIGTFKIQNVVLKSDLTLSGTIGDVDLSEEAVLKSVDNVVVSRKHFASELVIENSLQVEGTVDGIKIEEICKNVLVRDSEEFVSSLTINGNVIVEEQLVSEGTVSGIDLLHVNRTLVRVDQGAVIETKMVFEELYVEEEITLEGLLNGVDVQVLRDTYMSATRDQEIPAAMTFDSPVTLNSNLTCETITTIDHRMGGLNLEELYSTVLMIEGDQLMTGTLQINGNLNVQGDLIVGSRNVSGVLVPEDLALKTRANVIRGSLTIENDVLVTEEIVLNEGETIQGVDVSVWARTAVYKEGKYSITGIKSFDRLILNNVRAHKLFGGVEISSGNLLLTEGNQTINNLHIRQSLAAKNDVTVLGKVNGINIVEFRDSVVLRDSPNVINSRKTFLSDLRVNHMVSYGHVDTVNISVLTQQMEEPTGLYDLQNELNQRQLKIDNIKEIFEQPMYVLRYYEEVQRITTTETLSITSGTTVTGNSFLFFADSKSHLANGCIPITVLHYDIDRELYVPLVTLPSGVAVAMDTFMMDDLYVVLANVRPMLGCQLQETAGGLQIYRWRNSSFELFESRAQEMVLDVSTIRARISPNFAACIMATFADRVEVLCSSGEHNNFQVLQTIPSPLVRSIASIECRGHTILALANPSTSSVDIYIWDFTQNNFHVLQRVEAFLDAAVLFIPVEEECLLIVAEKSARSSKISVYNFETTTGLFNKVQAFGSTKITSMRWLPFAPNGALLFVLSGDFVTIFTWQGANGFVEFDKLDFPAESNTFHVFNRASDSIASHYLAVSSRVCLSSVWQQQESYSIILKAVTKGC